MEAVGGELLLARSEALPLRTDHPACPIRAMLGATLELGPHEGACVQILAHPVAGHRVTKARRPGALDRQTSLEHAAQDRCVVQKLRANLFETRIRYSVATTVSETLASTKR